MEIFGLGVEPALEHFDIPFTITYTKNDGKNNPEFHIYEISEDDFEKIKDVPEDQWQENWGFWRSTKGSILGEATIPFTINGENIYAWDGKGIAAEEDVDENEGIKVGDRLWDRQYTNLLEYIAGELGATSYKNIMAIATDMGKRNNMSVAELFTKLQPNEDI